MSAEGESAKPLMIFSSEKPSETFADLFIDSGTDMVECSCGRVHYDCTIQFRDRGEYRNILSRAAKDPDRYIYHEEENIHWGSLRVDGKDVISVFGCPCGGMAYLENLFWGNRQIILQYLTKRAQQLQHGADKLTAAVADANEANENK